MFGGNQEFVFGLGSQSPPAAAEAATGAISPTQLQPQHMLVPSEWLANNATAAAAQPITTPDPAWQNYTPVFVQGFRPPGMPPMMPASNEFPTEFPTGLPTEMPTGMTGSMLGVQPPNWTDDHAPWKHLSEEERRNAWQHYNKNIAPTQQYAAPQAKLKNQKTLIPASQRAEKPVPSTEQIQKQAEAALKEAKSRKQPAPTTTTGTSPAPQVPRTTWGVAQYDRSVNYNQNKSPALEQPEQHEGAPTAANKEDEEVEEVDNRAKTTLPNTTLPTTTLPTTTLPAQKQMSFPRQRKHPKHCTHRKEHNRPNHRHSHNPHPQKSSRFRK